MLCMLDTGLVSNLVKLGVWILVDVGVGLWMLHKLQFQANAFCVSGPFASKQLHFSFLFADCCFVLCSWCQVHCQKLETNSMLKSIKKRKSTKRNKQLIFSSGKLVLCVCVCESPDSVSCWYGISPHFQSQTPFDTVNTYIYLQWPHPVEYNNSIETIKQKHRKCTVFGCNYETYYCCFYHYFWSPHPI